MWFVDHNPVVPVYHWTDIPEIVEMANKNNGWVFVQFILIVDMEIKGYIVFVEKVRSTDR